MLLMCMICIAEISAEVELKPDGQRVRGVPTENLQSVGCDYKCNICVGSICTKCYLGYYLSYGYCLNCSNGCDSCSSFSYCSSCKTGYYYSSGYCYLNSSTTVFSPAYPIVFFVLLICICICICKGCNKRGNHDGAYVATGDNTQSHNFQNSNNSFGQQPPAFPVFPPPPSQPVFNNPQYNSQYNAGMPHPGFGLNPPQPYNYGMHQNNGQHAYPNNNMNYPTNNFN